MRAFFIFALVASTTALSLPIVSSIGGGIPIVGPILGGSGGSNELLAKLPIIGNLLESLGGVVGQLLNNILINVGIILNALLEIVQDAVAAVNIIVNGLVTGLLDEEAVQEILNILPSPLRDLVVNIVQAVLCILNDLQDAVPAVQTAIVQIIGVLTSPSFAFLDVNSQLALILNIVGQLTQDEVEVVNSILQRLADALNQKTCNPGIPTMPSVSLPPVGGFPSLPPVGGSTPSTGGIAHQESLFMHRQM